MLGMLIHFYHMFKSHILIEIFKIIIKSCTDYKRIPTPHQNILSLYNNMYDPKQNGYTYVNKGSINYSSKTKTKTTCRNYQDNRSVEIEPKIKQK